MTITTKIRRKIKAQIIQTLKMQIHTHTCTKKTCEMHVEAGIETNHSNDHQQKLIVMIIKMDIICQNAF